ncbi:MAG: flotillin family protein [bacterium]
MLLTYLPYIVIGVVVIAFLALLASGYVKAPPDTAYIISGLRKNPKIVSGGSGIRIPLLQRVDKLYLGQMSVDIKTEQAVPTNDFINVNVDAVAKVRVSPTPEGVQLAAKNFLNMNPKKIAEELKDSLQGNMREIIGTLELRAINTDRDSFSDQVVEKASKDMQKLGIEIISCNIQNVTDENGLIADLGMDNTAKIKKDAAIAKAEADKEVAIKKAEADRAANEARVAAETAIAERNNALAIKKHELDQAAAMKKAVADSAYEIQRQEQMKTVNEATVNAEIKKAEREAELREREVTVQRQTLAAEIKEKADADKYALEKKAEADLARRQREAEAEKYEKEKAAEAEKARADAEKYAAMQEAEGIRAKGLAEAEAIRAKGLAEANAMEKKAEAYQKYNQAAMAEMMIKVLPDVAKNIAEPLAKIGDITIIGGGNGGNGMDTVADNVPLVMTKLFKTMKEATGVDFAEILRADTYDAKVTRNINVTGLEKGNIPTEPIE